LTFDERIVVRRVDVSFHPNGNPEQDALYQHLNLANGGGGVGGRPASYTLTPPPPKKWKVVGVNVTINALLVILLIYMTTKTIPVLTTVQFKVCRSSLSNSLFQSQS